MDAERELARHYAGQREFAELVRRLPPSGEQDQRAIVRAAQIREAERDLELARATERALALAPPPPAGPAASIRQRRGASASPGTGRAPSARPARDYDGEPLQEITRAAVWAHQDAARLRAAGYPLLARDRLARG